MNNLQLGKEKSMKNTGKMKILIPFNIIKALRKSKSGRHPKTSTAFSAFSDRFYIVVRIAVFLVKIKIRNLKGFGFFVKSPLKKEVKNYFEWTFL